LGDNLERIPVMKTFSTKVALAALAVATLATGAAVTSVPAFAYDPVPGYNSQGGVVAVPDPDHRSRSDEYSRRLYNQSLPRGGNTVE
jgi:hypothetical protein